MHTTKLSCMLLIHHPPAMLGGRGAKKGWQPAQASLLMAADTCHLHSSLACDGHLSCTSKVELQARSTPAGLLVQPHSLNPE